MENYSIPRPLIEGIVGVLNTMPAHQSRLVLNHLEAVCTEQERADAEKQSAAKEAAIAERVKGELQAAAAATAPGAVNG